MSFRVAVAIAERSVKPGSSKPGVSFKEGALVLRVRVRPIEGAANEACLRAIAEIYRVPKSAITLISGARSRIKRFSIETS